MIEDQFESWFSEWTDAEGKSPMGVKDTCRAAFTAGARLERLAALAYARKQQLEAERELLALAQLKEQDDA